MLEIAVPEKAWNHPIIKSLHEAANDIITWGNVSTSLTSCGAKLLWKLFADAIRLATLRT